MKAFLEKYSDHLYSILRIVAGLLLTCHGAQKLFGVLGGQVEIHDPEGLIAGIVEFGGGILVGLGVLTRVSAFLCSGLMAVAYFKAHAMRGWFPIVNGGELAVIYSFVFLYILFRGPGPWSINALLRRGTSATTSPKSPMGA